jgi:pyrroline-5-carboxylate reductase
VIERLETARASLAGNTGCTPAPSQTKPRAQRTYCCSAVKPQDMRSALAPLSEARARKLVVSIAAGVRLADPVALARRPRPDRPLDAESPLR